MTGTTKRAGAALRKLALAYPEAYEEFPWGERALKVRKKVFLFLHYDSSHLSLSLKLPASHGAALMFPFAAPTGYGLGKAGWVTARFEKESQPPVQLLAAWVSESYRAVAPRRLSTTLDSGATPARARTPVARRPARRSRH